MSAEAQEEIFKRWVGQYQRLLFKVVAAYAASWQDREDLFQDILFQLWSSIGNFQGNAKETTWIYRVAINTALVWKRDTVRKKRRNQTPIFDFDDMPVKAEKSGDITNDRQIIQQLYEAIGKLPKIDSSLMLMYLDGLGYDEMAEVIGISKSNVGVKLNRAKKQLSQLMKGVIDEL